jgi:hypothetical protein
LWSKRKMKLNQDIISALKIVNEGIGAVEPIQVPIYESVDQPSTEPSRDQRMEELVYRLLEYAEMLTNFRSDSQNYDRAALEEGIRYDIGSDIKSLIEEFKK